MTNYRLEIINNQEKLNLLVGKLSLAKTFALDIETLQWWNKYRERVALIQIAYRTAGQEIKVAVIDALAELDLEVLRPVLESPGTIKIIHNAAFDAGKLFKHLKFKVAPVFDTMAAARRAGEKKHSLAAQVSTHLNLYLDKFAQRSDWSRRPLDLKQIDYAARDAYATLLLYEHQQQRRLTGEYRLKYGSPNIAQGTFDLIAPEPEKISAPPNLSEPQTSPEPVGEIPTKRISLTPEGQAILEIIKRLPDRYSPEQLVASVGLNRVGLTGWIIDQKLGREADFDEETAQMVIADLFDQKLVRINEFQKLEVASI